MIVNYGARITGNVKEGNFTVSGKIESTAFALSGKLIAGAGASEAPSYTGPYIVTPTQSTQVLNTLNKKSIDNIVVAPIPSNYGLITWNGSYLTVS